jgi:hypothetical protein
MQLHRRNGPTFAVAPMCNALRAEGMPVVQPCSDGVGRARILAYALAAAGGVTRWRGPRVCVLELLLATAAARRRITATAIAGPGTASYRQCTASMEATVPTVTGQSSSTPPWRSSAASTLTRESGPTHAAATPNPHRPGHFVAHAERIAAALHLPVVNPHNEVHDSHSRYASRVTGSCRRPLAVC